jgi:hypothetical protein
MKYLFYFVSSSGYTSSSVPVSPGETEEEILNSLYNQYGCENIEKGFFI